MGQSPYIGEIVLFGGNFAPRGWALCNGQILSISQNTALFSLLGTTYGGNGQTTFALPDLRGRVPLHVGGNSGQAPGLSAHSLGEVSGSENVTLTNSQMPQHNHGLNVSTGDSTSNRPQGRFPARGGAYDGTPGGQLDPQAVGASGGNQPHQNMQPYLGMNFIIALEGIFPSRN